MKCMLANEIDVDDKDILVKMSRAEFAIIKTLVGMTGGGGMKIQMKTGKMYHAMSADNDLPAHMPELVGLISLKPGASEVLSAWYGDNV